MEILEITADEHVSALGARIKARRLAANVSQADLAEIAGVTVRAIAKLEAGQGSTLQALARVMLGLGMENEMGNMVRVPDFSPMAMLREARSSKRKAR